ncbi:MAG: hypothetical protein EOM68_05195 [Spirochaetia bacterium]|nr:hypothetical protein [Spirochaetia bacterium]
MAKSKKQENKTTVSSITKVTKALSNKGKALSNDLQGLTVVALTSIYHCLTGTNPLSREKPELRMQIASLLDFDDQQEFDLYFDGFPLYLQEAVQRGTFEQYFDIRSLKTPEEKPLITMQKNQGSFYYRETLGTNPDLRLGLFDVQSKFVLALYPSLVKVFSAWLPKPSGYMLQPLPEIEGTPWSDHLQLSEVIPLLVEASGQILKNKVLDDVVRKGLLKGEIKSLRASCALESFPVAGSYGLDPIELFVQTLTHFEGKKLKRPDDGEAFVKEMVQLFFCESRQGTRNATGNEMEYFCLLRQFSKSAYSYSVETKHQGRIAMKELLHQMYVDGSWFSIENLFQSFVLHDNEFDFRDSDVLGRVLYLRGDSIETEFCSYEASPYDKGFRARGILQRMLFEKPLFKAYCYLFAAFGLVEIGEKPAPLVLMKNGKKHPLTPYEGICSMKVTPFGAWCLGFTDQRPETKKQVFETIADSNLLLVTFKGLSLERKIFLELIGDPMGTERYKISEVSFIRGCANPSEIRSRIERFKRLIDPNPSERWLSFFSMIEKRATLFAHGEAVLLYTFPDDDAIRKMFAIDPAFSKIIIRAEGNRIVIKKKEQALFKKLLAAHGYLNTLDL